MSADETATAPGEGTGAKLAKLKPAFQRDGGVVTAGNASSLADGAAALVLLSGRKLKALGLAPLARIRGFADAAQGWLRCVPRCGAALFRALQPSATLSAASFLSSARVVHDVAESRGAEGSGACRPRTS